MALTRDERDELVRKAIEADDQRYPPLGQPEPQGRQADYLAEQHFSSVADYFDGLPRITVSACPFCGAALERAFDPWGLDGPWWGKTAVCKFDEPPACEHFQVLLGAVTVDPAGVPARLVMSGMPGPEVPFVVPRLMDLPGMLAVVGKLEMVCSGPAYPIAFFSTEEIHPGSLHQEWRRTDMWYDRGGHRLWSVKNDVWDFDLQPFVDDDRLRWVVLDTQLLDTQDDPPAVYKASDGHACPFVNLPGERMRQIIFDGGRDLVEPPDGSILNPFEEDGA
jgi:hypothetical protein